MIRILKLLKRKFSLLSYIFNIVSFFFFFINANFSGKNISNLLRIFFFVSSSNFLICQKIYIKREIVFFSNTRPSNITQKCGSVIKQRFFKTWFSGQNFDFITVNKIEFCIKKTMNCLVGYIFPWRHRVSTLCQLKYVNYEEWEGFKFKQ